eukprot:1157840-Pelagomonas_calceolata.AAC.7
MSLTLPHPSKDSCVSHRWACAASGRKNAREDNSRKRKDLAKGSRQGPYGRIGAKHERKLDRLAPLNLLWRCLMIWRFPEGIARSEAGPHGGTGAGKAWPL